MIPLSDDNPSQIRPIVTLVVLAACVLVFLWQRSLGPDGGNAAVYAFGVIPAVLFGALELPAELDLLPAPLTIVSSMFLHGDWMHLIFNMLFLWIFADNVEDSMGHARFVVFYLMCGAGAAMAQALPDPQSVRPMIGASGAISGILGAYLLLFPRARVLVLVPIGFLLQIVKLPAALVLSLWFALQLLLIWVGGDTQVAFRAHVGGFVAGMLLIPFFKDRRMSLFQPRRE